LDKLKPKIAQKGSQYGIWGGLSDTDIQQLEGIAKQKNIKNMLFTGLKANESEFKGLNTDTKTPSPSVLHISTHGFFLPFSTKATDSTGASLLAHSPDAMRRSGLVLAGANRFWRNAADVPNDEDGILTADEIAQCNLQQTDLVVLSACETALGDVNGEGVFGLQRGFKQAGAKSILMSLWKIDDTASAEMMTAFYSAFLLENKSKQAAFESAQAKMRAKYPNSPYIWASFVLLD
jgi:CHAT domain-containing protein